MKSTVRYVYCVAQNGTLPATAPDGIDAAQVRIVANPEAGLCAVASELDASEYAAERASEMMLRADWLSPRAISHDAVVNWAADHADVVPLPMWVMFTDDDAVGRMLMEREREFHAVLRATGGAREFGVRVSADGAAMSAVVARLDRSLAELEQESRVASPGQAYLLGRKLAEQRKHAVRDIAGRTAETIHSRLSSLSRASSARATSLASEPGVILDGAYLVDGEQYDSFRSVVTELMNEYDSDGVRFAFTGPWPPYRFAHAT